MTTLAVGCEFRTTVNVAVSRAGRSVAAPEVGVTVMPALSLSMLVT